MGSQDILDMKEANSINRHDDQALGASGERARAGGVLLPRISGHIIRPPGGSIKAEAGQGFTATVPALFNPKGTIYHRPTPTR